ncbi:MAG: hypothetical protein R3A43_05020 [Bacteroidia bacterium]
MFDIRILGATLKGGQSNREYFNDECKLVGTTEPVRMANREDEGNE